MTIRDFLRNTALFVAAMAMSVELLSAREVITLSEDWQLFSVTEGSGDRAQNIALPNCWSLNPDTPQHLTAVNYTKTLYAPEEWRGKRVFLRFGGVHNVADLIVNGVSIGEHRGGSAAFSFEITPQIKYNEDNIVMIRVLSSSQNDILPTSVEHELYGGIYRDVELIITPQVAISPIFHGSRGVFVTTHSIENKSVKGDVKVKFIAAQPAERNVTITISDKRGNQLFHRTFAKQKINGSQLITFPFTLNGVTAWSPQTPELYDVKVELGAVSDKSFGNQMDQVCVTTGFRTITIAESGRTPKTLSINNSPVRMQGVSLYHDHPISGGVLTTRGYTRDLGIIKDMGANAIRSAIAPHDSELYSLCDQMGVMVWVDTPLAKSPYLSDVGYFPTPRFKDNNIQQLTEIIYQNYNHPSIIMWGLFSLLQTRDADVVAHLKNLKSKCAEIDTTRPTVALSNQNGDINTISDLIVWQQNLGWDNGQLTDIGVWSKQLHSRWGHMRSGVMYGEGGSIDHKMDRSEIPMCRIQQREGWFPEVRQSAQHEAYAAELSSDSLFWGMWTTAMFDYRAPRRHSGMNYNGLVTFDRNGYKDAFYLYRALWGEDQTLHIADKRARMVGDGDTLVTLRVYSSESDDDKEDDVPMAQINGAKSVKMHRVAPSQYVLDSVRVVDRTSVIVSKGSMKDSVEFIYGSPLRNRKR